MNRLYKKLKTLYRLGEKIFNSKDDALLYLQMNKTLNYKDLETITLYRSTPEFYVWPTSNSRAIITIETVEGTEAYYLSYSVDSPPYCLDLTLGILESNSSLRIQYKGTKGEIHPIVDFSLWKSLIDEYFNKGYHVRDGISPFQLYEHDSKFFATKQALAEYLNQNFNGFTDYRTINLYPNALGDDSDVVVVEDVYAGNRVDRLHFIKQGTETGKYQYFNYLYPIYENDGSHDARLKKTEIEWETCAILPERFSQQKEFGGTSWVCNEPVADSIFKASKNHHALITVTPVTPGSNHLFLYDGKFYTNFNDVFNRCKKDNRFLNDSVRVYEYSSEVSKTGAIKTYMYGDNAAECFAYCDENSYSRLGIDAEGNISSKEILDTSLDQIQQVFYYYMTKGLTPEDTTSRINKYFGEPNHRQKLSPLEKVLKPKK